MARAIVKTIGPNANVRALDSSGSLITLTIADNNYQIFNTISGQTVKLPTTGVNSGDRYKIENQGVGKMTIQSSGANQVAILDSTYAYIEAVALQAAPTTAAHWKMSITNRYDEYLADKSGGTNDIAYNGGNKATLSGPPATFTVQRCVLVPYQLIDGTWRLRLNMHFTHGASSGFGTVINGVTMKQVTTYNQPVAARSPSGTLVHDAYANPASNNIFQNIEGSETNSGLSGDVELDSKPTWAY